jgi:hypothetical protein
MEVEQAKSGDEERCKPRVNGRKNGALESKI